MLHMLIFQRGTKDSGLIAGHLARDLLYILTVVFIQKL